MKAFFIVDDKSIDLMVGYHEKVQKFLKKLDGYSYQNSVYKFSANELEKMKTFFLDLGIDVEECVVFPVMMYK